MNLFTRSSFTHDLPRHGMHGASPRCRLPQGNESYMEISIVKAVTVAPYCAMPCCIMPELVWKNHINASVTFWCLMHCKQNTQLDMIYPGCVNYKLCMMICWLPRRYCSTVSGVTLGTSLCDCITSASSFTCQPSIESAATLVDHVWQWGIHYRQLIEHTVETIT